MQLNDDRSQATLAINQTLTAAEIENLIRELAILRSQMTPEVRMTPNEGGEGQAPAIAQNEPALAFEHPARDPHVTMYLRSTALGWTAWRLHPQTQKALAEFFLARLPSVGLGKPAIPRK
ncbi:hypothetical protein [Acidovorax sp. sic0104]|uniref:hypothetical protein n=1 Tax=Acidovorax sp. sic0104 TaxID=2854784 RepID=UPI001C492426|nr:hypothetical protein [Acidovorax sp. sic0104]MBV7543308.1 hypothetical protein [Acidovorax sp. sic0104]